MFLVCALFSFSLTPWRKSGVKFAYPIGQKANLSKYNLAREDPAQDKTDQPSSSGLTSTHGNREWGDEVRWGEEMGSEDRDLSIPDRELWIEVIHRTVKIKTSSAKKKKKKKKKEKEEMQIDLLIQLQKEIYPNQKISTNTGRLCFTFTLSLRTPPLSLSLKKKKMFFSLASSGALRSRRFTGRQGRKGNGYWEREQELDTDSEIYLWSKFGP